MAKIQGISGRQWSLKVIYRLASKSPTLDDYISPNGSLNRYKLECGEYYKAFRLSPEIPMNHFVRQSLRALGGGARKFVLDTEKWARVDGGRASIHYNLKRYELASNNKCLSFLMQTPFEVLRSEIFSLDSPTLTLLSVPEVVAEYRLNVGSSLGLAYSHLNTPIKRGHYFDMMLTFYLSQMRNWYYSPPSSNNQFRFPWSISTRGKLGRIDDIIQKLANKQPVSRVVSVPHPSEHILSQAMYKPIANHIIKLVRDGLKGPISIGIRKNSYEWRLLGRTLVEYDYILCLDWSRFDTTIPRDLMMYAFRIMASCFMLRNDMDVNYIDNVYTFFLNNVIFSRYVYDSTVYDTDGGIPSGSIWTSVLGSVINYVVLRSIMEEMRAVTTYKIYVYGDDAVIGFNTNRRIALGLEHKRRDLRSMMSESQFIHVLSTIAKERYGMILSTEDTYITTKHMFCVGYKVPVFKGYNEEELLAGTGSKVAAYSMDVSDPFYTRDYTKGITHRWYYDFVKRPKYLKRYWDKWFRPIAPTGETISHLVNTERQVKNISHYEEILMSNIQDNPHNLHVINYGFHLYYDLRWLVPLHDIDTGKVLQQFDLFNTSSTYYKYIHEREIPLDDYSDGRVFYRRCKGYVPLLQDGRTRHWFTVYKDKLQSRVGGGGFMIELSSTDRQTYYDEVERYEGVLYNQFVNREFIPVKYNAQSWITYFPAHRTDIKNKKPFEKVVYEREAQVEQMESILLYLDVMVPIDGTLPCFLGLHNMYKYLHMIYGESYRRVIDETIRRSRHNMQYTRNLEVKIEMAEDDARDSYLETQGRSDQEFMDLMDHMFLYIYGLKKKKNKKLLHDLHNILLSLRRFLNIIFFF